MGPACEILIPSPVTDAMLTEIDDLLAQAAQRIERTHKGRVWDVWVDGRPIHVSIEDDVICLSSGLNASQDRTVLEHLSAAIVVTFDGFSSNPE